MKQFYTRGTGSIYTAENNPLLISLVHFNFFYNEQKKSIEFICFTKESATLRKYDDNAYVVFCHMKKPQLTKNKVLKNFDDQEFLKTIWPSKSYKNFNVYQIVDDGYGIVNKTNNKEIIYNGTDYFRHNYLNFLYFSSGKLLKKLNESLEVIDEKEFQGVRYSSSKFLDGYGFLAISNPRTNLAVIDLNDFEILALQPIDFSISQAFELEDKYYIEAGKQLFVWDGKSITELFIDKDVNSVLPKKDFFYISFYNDNNLYAFDTNKNQITGQQSSGLPDTVFWQITATDTINSAVIIDEYDFKGMGRLAIWTDKEFFSEKPWPIEHESAIFEVKKIPDNDFYSLEIIIDAAHDFGTVARQAMSILDETLSREAYQENMNDHYFSENFTGKIIVEFVNCRPLLKKHKSQLTKGCEQIHEAYWDRIGKATGEICIVDIQFID